MTVAKPAVTAVRCDAACAPRELMQWV